MGIYTRDNINYGGMLQAALQNKAAYLKNRYDRVAQTGQNWGNALKQTGQDIGNAMFKIAGNYYDQDKLAQTQAFQASEAEKRALEAMARQQEQQKFQEAQNELNRQNTMAIAKLNKDIATDEKQDTYQLNYQKAANTYNMLATELNKDPNNINLQKQVNDAKFDVEYWAKKAGRKIETTDSSQVFSNEAAGQATQPTATTPTLANDAIIKNIDESLGMDAKDWTNDERAKLLEQAKQIQDPGLRQQYLTRIKNKGDTVEEVRAATLALKAEAQASYDALPKLANGTVKPGALAKWKKANPKYANALGK